MRRSIVLSLCLKLVFLGKSQDFNVLEKLFSLHAAAVLSAEPQSSYKNCRNQYHDDIRHIQNH
jgi:hypothetical protein